MDFFISVVRKVTPMVLIGAVAILTLLAILSIWEVLPDDVTGKAIWSMALLGVVSLLFFAGAAVIQHDSSQPHRRLGIGWIILIIIVALFVLPNLFALLFLGIQSGVD